MLNLILEKKLKKDGNFLYVGYTKGFKIIRYSFIFLLVFMVVFSINVFELLKSIALIPFYLLALGLIAVITMAFSLSFISYDTLVYSLQNAIKSFLRPSNKLLDVIVPKSTKTAYMRPETICRYNNMIRLLECEKFFNSLEFEILSQFKAFSIYSNKMVVKYEYGKEKKSYEKVNKIKPEYLELLENNYPDFISVLNEYSSVLDNQKYLESLCNSTNHSVNFERAFKFYIEISDKIKRLSI